MLIWNEDRELIDWVMGIYRMNAGGFLQTMAMAAQRADAQNYAIIRPALLELKKKYPKYDVPGPEERKS